LTTNVRALSESRCGVADSPKLVLRECVSECAYFTTGDIPAVAATKIAPTGRKWVERCGFSSRTKLVECSRSATISDYVELFGSSEVLKVTFVVLVALDVL
jgi:hypothetical protein